MFVKVTTSPVTTTLNCYWHTFNAGEVISCPAGYMLNGMCDSLNVTTCGGFASEARCCQVDNFQPDEATCVTTHLGVGADGACSTIVNSYEYLLIKTCTSLGVKACENGTGLANTAVTNVSIYYVYFSQRSTPNKHLLHLLKTDTFLPLNCESISNIIFNIRCE